MSFPFVCFFFFSFVVVVVWFWFVLFSFVVGFFFSPFIHVIVIFANKTVLELDEKVNKQNGDSNI